MHVQDIPNVTRIHGSWKENIVAPGRIWCGMKTSQVAGKYGEWRENIIADYQYIGVGGKFDILQDD